MPVANELLLIGRLNSAVYKPGVGKLNVFRDFEEVISWSDRHGLQVQVHGLERLGTPVPSQTA